MRLQLTHALHRQLQQRPAEIASVYGDHRFTWSELVDRSARLAGALQALGMKPGDRVGMLAVNSHIYIEYMAGVWWGGGALNPVNIRWSPAEVAFSLDDCDTRILLIDDRFAGCGDELRTLSKSLQVLIYIGTGETPAGMLNYDELLRTTQPVSDYGSGGNDLAGIFYTGGTTGFPKGVMLSHEGLLSNAIGCLMEFNYTEDEIILAAAPIFHQAGMCIIIRAFVRGRRTVVLDGFDSVQMLETIERERVTFTLLVPTMIQRMLDCPDFAKRDISSLRRIIYGTSPIGEALLAQALNALPGVELVQGYGMTETGGPYTILPPHCHRLSDNPRDKQLLRSAGRPVWGMEMRIVDLDGQELPRGQTGEIVSRGAGVMLGYWNREAETKAAIRDGWMHSGDMGYMDEEGYVYIVDRLKDMIVSGGENVYSAEVESALGTHPAVAMCAVIAVPSDAWGEAVHAVVVLREGMRATAEELRGHCKTLIAGYKCPVSFEFRDTMPLSGAGKLLKHVLREPHWKDRNRRVG
ncbi:long-chain fatty acid--CoA ligase [Azospirillum sp. INR13]|uniref:acyl-CoA synthetase n=1 Tax=Azospirillum sp. INR13 TaxID=2596919 RepID=UPI001892281D|nr:long-chain fatty acid--CoA ligase [Azospirillum sp. INR13]MBF5096519.1 long-chain fatty acid--CoA ligase [Azospirillum sp. INR13]